MNNIFMKQYTVCINHAILIAIDVNQILNETD